MTGFDKHCSLVVTNGIIIMGHKVVLVQMVCITTGTMALQAANQI
jgi:hypothetical protein